MAIPRQLLPPAASAPRPESPSLCAPRQPLFTHTRPAAIPSTNFQPHFPMSTPSRPARLSISFLGGTTSVSSASFNRRGSAAISPSTLDSGPSTPARSARLPISYLLAAIFCAVLCAAHATSITLQGGFGYPAAKDSDGNPLEAGHKVSIGTFDPGPDIDLAAWLEENKSNLPALLAAWRQFHFTTTSTIDGDPGSFWLKHSTPTGTVPVTLPDGTTTDFSFPGKNIYLLLTRTDAAGSEPAPDASNVRDFALFTSTHTSWKFPSPPSETNIPPGDLRNLNTSQITTAIAGIADPSTGTFALTTYSSPETPGEPGTSAFEQWLIATFDNDPSVTAQSIVGPAGLSALATFALAADPADTTPPYTTITDENGRIGIEFTRKLNSGFNTYAQACTTLSEWALPVTESVVSSTDETETVHAFPDFPEGADTSKAFFRIRVEPAAN